VLPDSSNGFLSCLGDGLKERNRYLGSWALVAKIAADSGLLAHVRAYETNTEVVQKARLNWSVLEREGTVRGLANFAEANGFEAPEVRISSGQQLSRAFDLIFVDPPYLGGGDWSEVAEFGKHLNAIDRPFLIWYPFFWPTKPDVLISKLGLVSYEMHWADCGPRPSQNFKGCGVVPGGDLANLFRRLAKKLGAFCCNLGFRLVTRTPDRPIN
jgi:hypothetical protein